MTCVTTDWQKRRPIGKNEGQYSEIVYIFLLETGLAIDGRNI
jgi:hypothetical protein